MSSDRDWSVDDADAPGGRGPETDPDSTAEGMPRPDLSGIEFDPEPEVSPWSVDDLEPTASYRLPEIVPATADPEPAPSPQPSRPQPVPPVDRGPVMPPVSRPSGPAVAAPRPTAWHEQAPAVTPPPVQLRAPGRRPRVRRVTRVVRHVDPWSVFKVGLIFSLVAYVVCLSAGVLLWRVAEATGTIDNVERWFTQFGWETFEFKGDEIFRQAWVIGLFGVVALTGALVLLATLFNLVSDIVGGIRVTVLEEEVVERTVSSARRYQVRRPPATAHSGTAADPSWSVDDEPVTDAETATTAPASWSVDD